MKTTLNIAILPFRNLNGDKNLDYFSDGLTEEIINKLSQINELRVTSSTSSFRFKNTTLDLAEIAESLKVNALVEGAFRIFNDKLRISANLLEPFNDEILWSKTWDRNLTDIFQVQDELSDEVAEKLRENYWHFDFVGFNNVYPQVSLEAYQLYLKGIHYYKKWNQEDVLTAISLFKEAIALSSNYVEAYIGLADCYTFLGGTGYLDAVEAFKNSSRYCRLAAEINPNLPDLHFAIGGKYFWKDWNLKGAFQEINIVLESNPSYSEAHTVLALTYMLIGKYQLADKHINIALQLDPLSPNKLFTKGWICYLKREYEAAILFCNKAIATSPNLVPAIFIKACAQLLTGDVSSVIQTFEQHEHPKVDQTTHFGTLALCAVFNENDQQIAYYKKKLQEEISERTIAFLFLIDALLGNDEDAINWLKRAFKERVPLLLFLIVDPLIDPITKHADFIEIKNQLLQIQGLDFGLPHKKSKHPDANWIKQAIQTLNSYMEEEKPYLNSNLSLRILAEELNLQPNSLSWLINNEFGKNFNEYINSYRLEAFKIKVVSEEYRHLTLLGLAFECGFNSKSSFNTIFKKEIGMTPKAYQKQKLNEK